MFEKFYTNYDETFREHIVKELLEKIGASNQQYVFVFDGFDKRSIDTYNRNLLYFPTGIPENVRCIVSCDNEIKNMIDSLHTACEAWYNINLPLLCQEKSKIFIKNYFNRYNKVLMA
jgi:hypothetical protein